MSVLRYFARNSLVRLGAFGVALVATFIITPHMLRCLGKVNYGAWAFVSSLASYYLMLDLGMLQALSKHMAALRENGSPQQRNILFANSLFMNGAACLLALLGGVVVSLFIDDITRHAVSKKVLLACFGLFTLSMAVQLLCRTFYGLLVAQMRWILIACLHMVKTLAVSLAIFFQVSQTLDADANLIRVAIIVSSGNILESLCMIALSLKNENLHFALRSVNTAEIKKLLRFGFPVLVVSLGDFLRNNSQFFFVSAMLGLAQTTMFSLARQFINYTTNIMLNAFGILSPYFSRLDARKDGEGIRQSLLEALKLSYSTAAYLGLCLIFYSAPFLVMWLGPQFADVHAILLPMAVSSILSLGQDPANGYLYGVGRHSIIAVYGLGEGIFNAAACIPALLLFGLPGIGWTLLAGTVVVRLWLLPPRICAACGLALSRYYLVVAAAIIPQCLGQGLFYLAVRSWLDSGYLYLFLACAGQAVVAVAVFCAVSLAGGLAAPGRSNVEVEP